MAKIVSIGAASIGVGLVGASSAGSNAGAGPLVDGQTASTLPATVPSPVDPTAPWSAPAVQATEPIAELAEWWAQWMEPEYGCPLLAPIADPTSFGASGSSDDPWTGTAGGGPFIAWPGDNAPSMYVYIPPLVTSDERLAAYYAPDVTIVHYADGSEERLTGDGRFLVLLPGVGCGYEFDVSNSAQVEARNFVDSLRVIAPGTTAIPDTPSTPDTPATPDTASTTAAAVTSDETQANGVRCSLTFGTAVQRFADSEDFTWLTDTWGANSPLFRIGVDLGMEYIRIQYEEGTEAAMRDLAETVAELCRDPAFHNEVMQVEPGDPWYIDPAAGAPPPATEGAVSAPGEAMVVTASSYGGFDFGETWDQGGVPLGLPGTFGPRPGGVCTTPDLEVFAPDQALNFVLDPDGQLFGFTANASTMGPVRPGQPIDLAGTGLGWGATIDEIEQAFPSMSHDPLTGATIIQLDDGPLFLFFADDQLDALRGGDFCSAGGVVNVGD